MRVRRRHRAARDRSREGAVRRRPRERAAARRARRRTWPCSARSSSRRPDDKVLGHGPRPRRAPHARLAGERVGQVVQRSSATRSTARPSSSTMDRVRDLAREHRPKIVLAGFTAYPRVIDCAAFREIADEVGAILWVDASHFIGLCAGGAYPSPVPVRRRGDVHDAQDPARPARRDDPLPRRAREGDRQGGVPDDAGRPARARASPAKAVALKEAMKPGFRDYAHRVVRDAAGARRRAWPTRAFGSSRAGPTRTCRSATCGRSGIGGKDAEARLRRDRHRDQQERDPVRPAAPARPVGDPRRHARARDARDGRGRDEGGREHHRRGAARSRGRRP